MTFSVKVDEAAANFFRKMVEEKAQIQHFVALFIKDIENGASSEESFTTMSLWQEFLKDILGDISDFTEEERSDLNKAVRMRQIDNCSMVTQNLSKKFESVKDAAERPLYEGHSLFLPRIDKLV